MSVFERYVRPCLRRPTWIETLVIIAILAVAIALIIPAAKRAGSGDMQIPVRVLVFDATRGKPISGANVAIFRAPPLQTLKGLEADRNDYNPAVRGNEVGTTDADGTVVIQHEFSTGANHERPVYHAHLSRAWVHVQADGYGAVVIPVRHASRPTSEVRGTELVVPVGLIESREATR